MPASPVLHETAISVINSDLMMYGFDWPSYRKLKNRMRDQVRHDASA
jgi:hypothetical protein